MRFTHANRHCPDHPYEVLKRCDDDFLINSQPEEQSTEILKWLQKYREDRQHQLQQQSMSPSATATSRKTPKRPSSASKGDNENKKRIFSRSIVKSNNEILLQENLNHVAMTETMVALSPNKATRKGLVMCEMDMNAGAGILQISTPIQVASSVAEIPDLSSIMGSPITANKPKHCKPKVILWKEPIDDVEDDLVNNVVSSDNRTNSPSPYVKQETVTSSPVKKSFNPKKKWLREAWQEDHSTTYSDLGARPLEDCGVNHPLYNNHSQQNNMSHWQMVSSTSSENDTNINPNQNRPSVLIMGRGKEERRF